MLVKIILTLMLIPSLSFAANYYVDPTHDGSNGSPNGSFLRPWTNISGQVRNHTFSTGDSLYFKSGTVTPMNFPLYIRWHGTAQNRVIIGTYFGENDFGNGNVDPSERAVLDGQNFLIPATEHTGMIQAVNRPGYVTIQDLEIKDSGSTGVFIGNTGGGPYPYINQHFIVRNVFINRPWASAMTITRSSYNQILNNTAYRSSHGNNRTHPHRGTNKTVGGAAIEITGQHVLGVSEHNVVSGNTVSMSAYEGIGFYQRSRYGTISNNVVFDCSVNIYIDGSSDIDVYGNLVYGTPEAYRGSTAAGFNNVRNITLNHEYGDRGHFLIEHKIENVRVFNNYVAGGAVGITVAVNEGVTWGWKNVEIFNNRLVDNGFNFSFWRTGDGGWENNYIYGNYSLNYDNRIQTHIRANMDSPDSFTWNRAPDGKTHPNYFTGGTMPAGNAGQGASLNNAHLAKKTGMSDLTQLEVTVKYFSLEGGAETAYEEKQKSEPKKVKNVMIIKDGVVN